MCEKKTKSSFSDKFARFEKLLEFWLVEKFRLNLGLTENSAETDRKKIKKNKKEKRIFVKLRQFSKAYQLTENVVSRICSLYHEIKTFGNEQAPRS